MQQIDQLKLTIAANVTPADIVNAQKTIDAVAHANFATRHLSAELQVGHPGLSAEFVAALGKITDRLNAISK